MTFLLFPLCLVALLTISQCSDQKISTRAPFGMKLFSFGNAAAVSKRSTDTRAKLAFPSLKIRTFRGFAHNTVHNFEKKHLHVTQSSIGTLSSHIKKSLKTAKKECSESYKFIAEAKDNFDRLDRTIEVLVSHKRTVFVVAAGLLALHLTRRTEFT